MPTDPRNFGHDAKRILVVEDDGSMRALATQALRNAGYHVTTAKDGHTALAALREYSVDLIVCDVAMPGMDGRALGHALMKQPGNIPILYISALEDLPATLPGAFLRKPFAYTDLIAMVGEILAKRR